MPWKSAMYHRRFIATWQSFLFYVENKMSLLNMTLFFSSDLQLNKIVSPKKTVKRADWLEKDPVSTVHI